MPKSEKASLIVSGAVLGVLGVLLTLFALVGQMDGRYPTRREYDATLSSINQQLSEIKTDLRTPMSERSRP